MYNHQSVVIVVDSRMVYEHTGKYYCFAQIKEEERQDM
jgi:hypothetical protein